MTKRLNAASIRFCQLTLLWVFVSGAVIHSYLHLPQYWIALVRLQKIAVDHLSHYLLAINGGFNVEFIAFSSVAYLYGALHALAPGHGKTALLSTCLLHACSPRKILFLVATVGLMQGLSACFIYAVANQLLGQISNLSQTTQWISKACALFIIALALKYLYRLLFNSSSGVKTRPASPYRILVIGLRPCTSALLTLFLASMLQRPVLGYFAAFFMATGTITTGLIFVFFASHIQGYWLKSKRQYELDKTSKIILVVAMGCSGVFLLMVSRFIGLPSFLR